MSLQNIFQELPDEHSSELRGNPLNEPHGKHLSQHPTTRQAMAMDPPPPPRPTCITGNNLNRLKGL